MIRPLPALCVLLSLATLVAIPVASQPVPGEITFSKTVEAGVFTVEVAGTVAIDPAARTVSGTIFIAVKDGDTEIVNRTIEFTNVAATGTLSQDILIEEGGVIVHVTVDPETRTVGVSVELTAGNADRIRP